MSLFESKIIQAAIDRNNALARVNSKFIKAYLVAGAGVVTGMALPLFYYFTRPSEDTEEEIEDAIDEFKEDFDEFTKTPHWTFFAGLIGVGILTLSN